MMWNFQKVTIPITSSKLDTSSKCKLETHNFILLTEEGKKNPNFSKSEKRQVSLKSLRINTREEGKGEFIRF